MNLCLIKPPQFEPHLCSHLSTQGQPRSGSYEWISSRQKAPVNETYRAKEAATWKSAWSSWAQTWSASLKTRAWTCQNLSLVPYSRLVMMIDSRWCLCRTLSGKIGCRHFESVILHLIGLCQWPVLGHRHTCTTVPITWWSYSSDHGKYCNLRGRLVITRYKHEISHVPFHFYRFHQIN